MDYKNISIKQWAVDDRPREKLLSKGIYSLSDAELIAILLGSGSRNESAVELAKKILNTHNNNLNELGKVSIEQLIKNKGVGKAKAVTIMAAMELGRRRKLADVMNRPKVTQSADVYEIFKPMLADLPYEEFWVILLNRSNKIIAKEKISQGGVSGTVTDIRLILKKAIEKLACSLILCHNHPSGNLKPSESDISITKKLSEAGKFMEINVLDHIIVTDQAFYSFADEGYMG